MKENSEQETGNSKQEAQPQQPQPSPQTPSAGSSGQPAGSSEQAAVSSKQGMSSGAKWGIGLGACCCCLIIAFLIFIILGFAGCSFVRGLGGYNWPAAPPIDEGTEIPIPSFSNTPTSTK